MLVPATCVDECAAGDVNDDDIQQMLPEAELSNIDAFTLHADGLYTPRTSVSSSQLKAWWRLGDDGNIVNRTSPFDADSSATLTTTDLLEEQQNEKTNHITEELILYLFLGIFIIFVLDSFARASKYIR